MIKDDFAPIVECMTVGARAAIMPGWCRMAVQAARRTIVRVFGVLPGVRAMAF
jgi:hypothetical protein